MIRAIKKNIYLFLERGREGKEGEKQCVVASHMPPTGGLAHNPGMCPEWESNRGPSGSQAGTQSTEPHQAGLGFIHFYFPFIHLPHPHSLHSPFIIPTALVASIM